MAGTSTGQVATLASQNRAHLPAWFFFLSLIPSLSLSLSLAGSDSGEVSGCGRCWSRARAVCAAYWAWPGHASLRRVCEHTAFSWALTAAIIINTVMLASEHHGQSQLWTDVLSWGNHVFTFVFLVEVAAKLGGLGPKEFWSSGMNRFDLLVVASGLGEWVLHIAEQSGSTGLAAFRAVRLLRLAKLARSWESLHRLLRTMAKSLLQVGHFVVLVLLFAFVFALLGVRLFAGKMYDADTGEVARSNFDSFGWALVVVFQLVTGENWNEVMADAVSGTSWAATTYFLAVYLLGGSMPVAHTHPRTHAQTLSLSHTHSNTYAHT